MRCNQHKNKTVQVALTQCVGVICVQLFRDVPWRESGSYIMTSDTNCLAIVADRLKNTPCPCECLLAQTLDQMTPAQPRTRSAMTNLASSSLLYSFTPRLVTSPRPPIFSRTRQSGQYHLVVRAGISVSPTHSRWNHSCLQFCVGCLVSMLP